MFSSLNVICSFLIIICFEYGVTPAVNKNAAGNYVNFVLGVVLVIGIYLIAGAFGI